MIISKNKITRYTVDCDDNDRYVEECYSGEWVRFSSLKQITEILPECLCGSIIFHTDQCGQWQIIRDELLSS
tara:strand:+ start:283 stop:498 length:216 start_codon:yes stop_codon:yes gene_type:complete